MEASTGFQRQWEARQSTAESVSLAPAPKSVINEAVKVKPKLQWRLQKLRDASTMNCLMRKVACCRESQSKRQSMCPANGKVKRTGLSQPSAENILLPCVLDAICKLPSLFAWVGFAPAFYVCSHSSILE